MAYLKPATPDPHTMLELIARWVASIMQARVTVRVEKLGVDTTAQFDYRVDQS